VEARRGRPGVGLAVVVGLVQVLGARWAARGGGSLDALGYALLLAGPAALVFRRRFPLAVFFVSAAAATTYGLMDRYPGGPYVVAAVLALLAAMRAQRHEAVLVCLLSWLAAVFAGRILPDADLREPTVTQAVLLALGMLALLFIGEGNRVRGEFFEQEARTRTERRRRQASEERLRIAQELHDVIGHHLSVINVQAGVGLHLMDTQPEQARTSLTAIKQASAEALREVRSVLAALQDDGQEAPRAPAPSLDRVGDLATGLQVEIRVEGTARPLPAEVDRAAYRIIQESLTNVRRHGGPSAAATVVIGYADSALTVQVDDDGVGASAVPSDGGAGLPGMRERAVALGGTFEAGPGPGGGFRVVASIPLKEVP
jgi:signal transduction histidine kinase